MLTCLEINQKYICSMSTRLCIIMFPKNIIKIKKKHWYMKYVIIFGKDN